MTTLKIVAGSAGSGKSTALITGALDYLMQLKSVFIMVPTHTAKENLVNKIDTILAEAYKDPITPKIKITNLEKLKYSVHVLYGYRGEEVVLIDEMSMINVPTLKMLFWDTYFLPSIQIVAYGDAKQIDTVQGNSMIEELLRINIETDLWQWVKDAYENATFSKLVAPANWRLDGPVEFQTMLHNYRLNNLGYSGYNEEYIEALFDKAIDYSDTDKDYSEVILEATKNFVLITSPTHDRGSEVNAYIREAYPDTCEQVFPFVKQNNGTKVYLNPWHPNQTMLHEKFPFVKDVPSNEKPSNLDYTGYVVVDVSQGATVDNALYYFGNKNIPRGKVKSFYNYNRLFTAITRSRNLTQLVGNTKEIRKQLDIFPVSAKKRLEYRVADKTVTELFNRLYNMPNTKLTLDEIYELYMKLFEIVTPDEATMRELDDYNVDSSPYTKAQLVLKFKNYDMNEAMKQQGAIDVPNYKKLIYDKHISSSRQSARSGKGKVQLWVSTLSEKELAEVKSDLETLSVRKFKAKYKQDKRQVEKAINN